MIITFIKAQRYSHSGRGVASTYDSQQESLLLPQKPHSQSMHIKTGASWQRVPLGQASHGLSTREQVHSVVTYDPYGHTIGSQTTCQSG
jgi:hypothetical protein